MQPRLMVGLSLKRKVWLERLQWTGASMNILPKSDDLFARGIAPQPSFSITYKNIMIKK